MNNAADMQQSGYQSPRSNNRLKQTNVTGKLPRQQSSIIRSHQKQVIAKTERMGFNDSDVMLNSKQKPSFDTIWQRDYQQKSPQSQNDIQFKDWKQQQRVDQQLQNSHKQVANATNNRRSHSARRVVNDISMESNNGQNENEDGYAQNSLHISSSRIQESYFDDEMQAKVSRSSRKRHRYMSEGGDSSHRIKKAYILGEEGGFNTDKVIVQTQRMATRIGQFIQSKYKSLVDYIWSEPHAGTRYFKPNRIMQAPPDDSIMEEQINNHNSASNEKNHSQHASNAAYQLSSSDDIDDPRVRNNRLMTSSDEQGSIGYITAFSKSRSRSAMRGRSRYNRNEANNLAAGLGQNTLLNAGGFYEQPINNNLTNIARVTISDQNNDGAERRGRSTTRGRQVRFPSDLQINDSDKGTTFDYGGDESRRGGGGQKNVVEAPSRQQMVMMHSQERLQEPEQDYDSQPQPQQLRLLNQKDPQQTTTSPVRQERIIELKSISVQADHIPSKTKKKLKAADLSKRSIGVGSLCIDDTTIEVSKALLGSIGSKSSMGRSSKRRQRKAVVADDIVQKKHYLSSEREELKRNKDQTVSETTLKHQQLQQSEAIPSQKVVVVPQQESPVKHHSKRDEGSSSKLKAFYEKLAEHEKLSGEENSTIENHIDKNHSEKDVDFNPDEQDEENYQFQNSNQQYFENTDVEDVIIYDLKQEWLDEISDCSFIPNYQNNAAKKLHPRSASQMSVNQLDRGQFVQQSCASILAGGNASGSNRAQKNSTAQGGLILNTYLTPLMAYQSDSEAPKRRIRLPKIPSRPTAQLPKLVIPQQQQQPPQQACSRSRSPVKKQVVQNVSSRKEEDTAMAEVVPAVITREQQELMKNLFSDDKEMSSLKEQPPNQQEIQAKQKDDDEESPPGITQTFIEPASELFLASNDEVTHPDISQQKEQVNESSITKQVLLSTTNNSTSAKDSAKQTQNSNSIVQQQPPQNHRYGEQSSAIEDLTLINFELSKDISQSMMMHYQNTTVNGQAIQSVPGLSQTNIGSEAVENMIFPPQNLHEPIEEDSQATRALLLQYQQRNIAAKPPTLGGRKAATDIIDELDTISRIVDDDVEDFQIDQGLMMQQKKSVIPTRSENQQEELKDGNRHGETINSSQQCQQIEFYSRAGSPMISTDGGGQKMMVEHQNLEDAEVVFQEEIGQTENDDDELEDYPQMMNSFKISSKHNRSTTAAVGDFKNHFLSSASEDEADESGQGIVRKKALRRAAIKGVSLATMHSSVNNGRPRVNHHLPLYGQKAGAAGGLRHQKTIREVTYRSPSTNTAAAGVPQQQSQAGDQPATTAASDIQGAGKSSQKSMTVSERFKASLKAFKTNKLIKPGTASASMNSSKQSMAAMSQKSRSKDQQP